MARGNGGDTLFNSLAECREFVETVARVKDSMPFELYAYCLMSNHIHLFIRILEASLSAIMQRLLGSWARRFNLYNERRGHLFQGRFKSILCVSEDYARRLVRYIHRNPVAAGLVKDPADWRWSSHRDYLGLRSDGLVDVEWPLRLFGDTVQAGRKAYLSYLEDASDPFGDETMDDSHSISPLDEAVGRPLAPLEFLLAQTAEEQGVSAAALAGRSRVRTLSAARRRFARLSSRSGHSLSAIAGALGVTRTAVTKMLIVPELDVEGGRVVPGSFES
ncbi:MAG: transposase [Elusimicrobia bacterium]|nr:transposase [Elusimicrobiota bacterium]